MKTFDEIYYMSLLEWYRDSHSEDIPEPDPNDKKAVKEYKRKVLKRKLIKSI